MFKISRALYHNKQYLMNLLEYQIMGINLKLYNSNCDVEKFFLLYERDEIHKIQNKLYQGHLSNIEIKEYIKDIHIDKKN